jgi:formamidopyrimidine-DNA glycosylase
MILRRDGKLKSVLMDPTFLVGIGPIYSDEILFHSGLRYDRNPSSLSAQEIRRLYRAVVETVHEAVKYGGTSLGADGWVGLSGEPGEYQQYITVYKRDGEMSPRARGPIVKTRFGSGYTYYCEQTQV